MRVIVTQPKKIISKPITLMYGEPGIGKTTFASKAPNVVFVNIEKGADNIEIQRARIDEGDGKERDCQIFEEVQYLVDSLIAGAEASPAGALPFENVCIDSADALELFIQDYVCRISNKKSIASFKYGSGYDFAFDNFKLFWRKLERLRELGVGVIVTAHAKVEKFANPEGQDFDYYEIKCHKKIAGHMVQYADNVLFARREQAATDDNGKIRGVSSNVRFIHTQKHAAWVAKNRYNLPDKMPLNWAEYQAKMDAFVPAKPDEMVKAIEEILPKLEEEDKKKAKAAFNKIDRKDSHTLAQFLDFCRSQLAIETGQKVSEQNATK